MIGEEVLELGVFVEEANAGGSGGSVALFTDDDLGDTAIFGFRIIDFVAINKDDHVGVLLKSSRVM